MRLENKKAIVTGGAGGIGRATSIALAAEGAAVAVVDLNAEAAEAVAAEIREAGGTAVAIAADVASEADIESVVAGTVAEFGGVDVVFNNAGIIRRTTAVETTVEEWDRVFGVNVRSIFLMCKHVVPIMEAAGGGSIINTGSGWGLKGGGQAISYCASKGGLTLLTHSLALELAPHGIRVNTVAPGNMLTEMHLDDLRVAAADRGTSLDAEVERVRATIPLGRIGTPEEVAWWAAALCSRYAGWITGETLVVDGGHWLEQEGYLPALPAE